MNMTDLTITSLETITAFDVSTGAFLWILDELQNATIQNSQETTDITGKGGRVLSSLKRNKSVTISGNNGLISGGLLETQTGGSFESKLTDVEWTDYLVVSSNTATTSYKAAGTAGAEIISLFIRNSDGTAGAQLVQDTTASSGKFAYNPTTGTLTFSGIADNTEIVVIYKRRITASVLENDSATYSKKATLYIDAMAEDKCNNVYRVQFYIPKADFSGEFSIELGDNQTVHAFEARSLAGACGTIAASGLLWTYTVFGVNDGAQIKANPTVVTVTQAASGDVQSEDIAISGATGTVTAAITKGGTSSTAISVTISGDNDRMIVTVPDTASIDGTYVVTLTDAGTNTTATVNVVVNAHS